MGAKAVVMARTARSTIRRANMMNERDESARGRILVTRTDLVWIKTMALSNKEPQYATYTLLIFLCCVTVPTLQH